MMQARAERQRAFADLFKKDGQFQRVYGRDAFDTLPTGVELIDYDLSYEFSYAENPVWMVFQWQDRLYKIRGTRDSYGNTEWWPWYVQEVEATQRTVTVYE